MVAKLAMETTTKAPASPGLAAPVSGQGGVQPPMGEALDRRLSQVVPGLGSMKSIRAEIDAMNEVMTGFCDAEPDEVMQHCSGFSSRLVEIRRAIFRIEDFLTHWKPLRIQEVTPLIEETRFQYEVASRLLTVRMHDWNMERGNT
jgi:hypothetical protein